MAENRHLRHSTGLKSPERVSPDQRIIRKQTDMRVFMDKSGFGMFCFWRDMHWCIRMLLPVAVLAISGVLLYYGFFFKLGWVAGILLLLFGGRSRSEKNGYRF